jgi:hypothetical protein
LLENALMMAHLPSALVSSTQPVILASVPLLQLIVHEAAPPSTVTLLKTLQHGAEG